MDVKQEQLDLCDIESKSKTNTDNRLTRQTLAELKAKADENTNDVNKNIKENDSTKENDQENDAPVPESPKILKETAPSTMPRVRIEPSFEDERFSMR